MSKVVQTKKKTRKIKQDINLKSFGTSGTQVFSGRVFEEYLAELRGRTWADKVDQMRRSDPIVRMVLRALKLPLVSAQWSLVKKDDSPEAIWQEKLFNKVLFHDMSRSFTKTLWEILTCYDFGYSLFEKVHGIAYDKELGYYNTIRKLGYRSQRTIEAWNINPDSQELESVTQLAIGDFESTADIPAKFLVHFAPEMEGDNFEGTSATRSMYGPYLRKNEYLKLVAAGVERYFMATPKLKVPKGKENSKEFENAQEMLESYTSNECQYLTFPEGWELDLFAHNIDTAKATQLIDFEDKQMVNSALCAFLLLGQTGGGSYSLSQDLSDFFAQTLQFTADHVSEVLSREILQDVLDKNSGDQELLCEIVCDNLRDRPDKIFAETLQVLITAGVLKPDTELEKLVRSKFRLPEKQEEIEEQIKEVTRITPQLSEKNANDPVKLVNKTVDLVKEVFEEHIAPLGLAFIDRALSMKDKSTNRHTASMKLETETDSTYLPHLEYVLAKAAFEAKAAVARMAGVKLGEVVRLSDARDYDKAQAELKKLVAEMKKTPDNKDLRIKIKKAQKKVADIAKRAASSLNLTREERQAVRARAQVLIDTQTEDIYKALNLQFQNKTKRTQNDVEIRFDLRKKLESVLNGPIVNVGADAISSDVIQNERLTYAKDADLGVESMTFVATIDDRTTPICNQLDGKTFSVDNPKIDQFQPPLHYNCRSFFRINLVGGNNPKTDDSFNPSSSSLKSITFSEKCCGDSLENRYFKRYTYKRGA